MNRCFAVGLLARACRRVAWAEVEPKAATEAAYVRRAVLAEVCACAATSLALPAARSGTLVSLLSSSTHHRLRRRRLPLPDPRKSYRLRSSPLIRRRSLHSFILSPASTHPRLNTRQAREQLRKHTTVEERTQDYRRICIPSTYY